MREKAKKTSLKGVVLKTALIFILSYLVFLFFWLGVKGSYGKAVTGIASSLVAGVQGVTYDSLKPDGERYLITFAPRRYNARMFIDIYINTSSYTFNAPLTFAIMAAFCPFLLDRTGSRGTKSAIPAVARIYGEVLLMLFLVHILYVFSAEGEKLTGILMGRGYEDVSKVKLVFWQFLWGFVDNMVIRFEPFLIGAFLYFRIPARGSGYYRERA